MKNEIFIQKAILKHKDKYDYSKVNYIHSKSKVIIICKEHGEFEQTPANHIFGQGCYNCHCESLKSNTDDFILKSLLIHNEYDYSKVDYIDSKTKVTIICKEHGEFEQIPNTHLKGKGCLKCSINKKRLTTKEYINNALKVHNGLYDYSKVNYINTKTKICIICEKHGEFLQNPNNHLQGKGCLKCANDDKRSNEYDFINKSKKIHKDKYDYSLVEYKKVTSKVKIICKEHGIFEQIPNTHLSGSGCPKCCSSTKINTIEFIKRANERHNNKYDYSYVEYVNSETNVNIICKEHDLFSQKPANHLIGNGCPKCGTTYGIKENKWLDIFNIKKEYRQYKIDKYFVDGYDPETNTIYEFNGDFWHGNPIKYKKDDVNIISGKTFGYLLEKTLEKENKLKQLGYNVISIWESDYNLKEKVLS
jgi:hypothetical protein